MPISWLSNVDPAADWARRTWSDLAAIPDKAGVVVVLPVHGFADHGLGMPLDVEEVVGSAVLRAAGAAYAARGRLLVLPPLRFVAAPYGHTFFGVDAETALEAMMELAASVAASGFSRLLFFNTSPWNAELVATAAIDARVAHDLRTYVIHQTSLGLGFFPNDPNRARTQAVAARLLGRAPSAACAPGEVRDVDFRPGFYGRPSPVVADPSLEPGTLFSEAAAKLAGLLGEIIGHRPGSEAIAASPTSSRALEVPPPCVRAEAGRDLALMTGDEVERVAEVPGAWAIIPMGAIEQHGHHLPLGTDAMLNQLWLARALPKLPADAPVFVAPPMVVGKSNEHLGFSGTLTVSARTLRRQLLALAGGLRGLGFRQVAIFNTHGGNSATAVATVRELQTTLGLRAGLLANYYRPKQSEQEAAFGFHAGDWETSLMLAGDATLVRMDRAVCEYPARVNDPGVLRPEGAAAVFAWKTSDISKSGVMGDATIATKEKGELWLEESASALARKITGLL